MIKALARRVSGMVGRAVLTAIDDSTKMQVLQLSLLADETADGAERFQQYGFSSVPFPDAEAVVVFAGGLRSHPLVIAVDDRRHRPMGGQPGEVSIYDDQGQSIVLMREGIVITTDKPVTVNAQSVSVTADQVTITSDEINLGDSGGAKVARVGDTVSGGVITSGSDKVKAA